MRQVSNETAMGLYTPATLALIFIVGISYLGLGFVMPLRALYGRDLGATSVQISLMATSFLLTGFLATPLIGWASDRFHYRTILVVGLLIHTCTTLAYAVAQDPVFLIVLRGIEGVAAVGVLPPARAMMNTIAPRSRQGEALGLISAAQTGGILIGPAVGALLASQTGYALSFLLAAIPLGLSVIITLVVLPDVYQQDAARHASTAESVSLRQMMRQSLFTRELNVAYLFQFLLFISSGIAASIWSLYMLDRGASLPMIGLSYTTFALPIVLLAPFAGRFSDRYGRYRPLLLGLLLCTITFSLYYLPLTVIWIVIISMLEGTSLAIVRAAVDGFVADVMPGDQKGKVQATYNAAGTIGSLCGSVASGILYLRAPGLPFLMEGVLYLLTFCCAYAMPGLRSLFSEKHISLEEA